MTPDPDSWTILLADDEEDIREVLSMTLEDMGYHLLVAEDGRRALEIFRDKRPPIIMTDIKMPVMDGIELLRAVKREDPEVEVIMITGHGDMGLAIQSLKHDATDFITKPINVDIIEIALGKVTEKIVTRRQLKAYTANLETLLREKTELKDHLSSLGLMIGSISHGIKGLLTGLDGGMYLVDSGFDREDLEKIAEGWGVVKLMVERIRKMILDILYYAKKRDLNWETVDAYTFAQELADVFARQAEKHAIELVRKFDPAVGEFEIDPGSIHSALVNILENAVDACLKETTRSHHRIVFSVCAQGDHIRFDVSDNGVGMDRETRDKLFTLFFSSKGSKGTGLGLFVSQKIIAQHGGEISVHSTPGQGARFTIQIPKLKPREVDAPISDP